MNEAVRYTDYFNLGILLNEKLITYNALKKQDADLIQTVCKEEDLHISRLEHDIWMPFWVCFAEEKKECDGEEYGVFCLAVMVTIIIVLTILILTGYARRLLWISFLILH